MKTIIVIHCSTLINFDIKELKEENILYHKISIQATLDLRPFKACIYIDYSGNIQKDGKEYSPLIGRNLNLSK